MSTHYLIYLKQVKLFSDDAYISQLMQVSNPGYIDGHKGKGIIL